MKKILVITKDIDEKTEYYKNSLLSVSLEPVISTTFVEALDYSGLVITGGIDVDPSFYGEEKDTLCGETDISFDELCFKEIEEFISAQKPIFGICRGLQLLNVYFKGTLYQNISNHVKNDYSLGHEVFFNKNSFLCNIYGDKKFVNSEHHQAIKKLGDSLKSISISSDGIIEAVECEKERIIAVQWHPERMTDDKKELAYGLKLFEYFKSILD